MSAQQHEGLSLIEVGVFAIAGSLALKNGTLNGFSSGLLLVCVITFGFAAIVMFVSHRNERRDPNFKPTPLLDLFTMAGMGAAVGYASGMLFSM